MNEQANDRQRFQLLVRAHFGNVKRAVVLNVNEAGLSLQPSLEEPLSDRTRLLARVREGDAGAKYSALLRGLQPRNHEMDPERICVL